MGIVGLSGPAGTPKSLHQFTIGGEIYADDRVEDSWGGPPTDENRFRLDNVAPLAGRFRDHHDFGDGWEHGVVVEKILPPEPAVTYPRCLTGRRACPPDAGRYCG